MTAIRQDAWNHDEDLLLAETVLRHIREGSTQLAAFEEVGKKLSRTSAACGFRWNSLVRKKYENAITLAKKQRKQLKLKRKQRDENDSQNEEMAQEVSHTKSVSFEKKSNKSELSLDNIITYLSGIRQREETYLTLEKENRVLREALTTSKKNEKDLHEQLETLQKEYQMIQNDYKALMDIMERARQMVVFDHGESSMRVHMANDTPVEKVNK